MPSACPPHRRILLLGAGFNAPLGMPLTADLLRSAHAIARRKPWRRHDGRRASEGMADWLLAVLDWYYPLAGIDHEALATGRLPPEVSLEEFLSFIAARAAVGYRAPQDVDAEGTLFIDCVRAWIGEALAMQQARSLAQPPDWYLAFARRAREALVISFNWDTVLEELWRWQGIRWRHGIEAPAGIARLLKVHGSIDWFGLADDLVPMGEDLPEVGRAADLQLAYAAGRIPRLVLPSFDKTLQLLPFDQLWQKPWSDLDGCGELVVIGYSIRPDDFHSRAVLYPQMVRQARGGRLKVKVIDVARDEAQRELVRARYAGVAGAEFCFEGFTPQAVEFAFD